MHRMFDTEPPEDAECLPLPEPCFELQFDSNSEIGGSSSETEELPRVGGLLLKRKRDSGRECTKCGSSTMVIESQPDTDPKELFCLECEFCFRARGRQGRNAESRLRRKIESEENPCEFRDLSRCVFPGCLSSDCLLTDMVTGDLVCTSCGLVNETGGMAFPDRIVRMAKCSKSYNRSVHFQQRMAQLTGTDPPVKEEYLKMFEQELEGTDASRMGKKTFSGLCGKLSIPKKVSNSWIQIRNELGIRPNTVRLSEFFQPELMGRLRARYRCVENAFMNVVHTKNNHSKNPNDPFYRTNIVHLNYVIPMILRMESPQLWGYSAKYFKQLSHNKQPRLNNRRWKRMMRYCRKHYSKTCDPNDGNEYFFEWPYNPLTHKEILRFFNYFY